MGSDIHIYIEYKDKDAKVWWTFGNRFRPERNYCIFAKMCGVRNSSQFGIVPLSKPKGLPEDISLTVKYENQLFIDDNLPNINGYCNSKFAEEAINEGYSKRIDEHCITNPNWHSHSWLTADELETVFNDPQTKFEKKYNLQWLVILSTLRTFENLGCDSRIVFWFDN